MNSSNHHSHQPHDVISFRMYVTTLGAHELHLRQYKFLESRWKYACFKILNSNVCLYCQFFSVPWSFRDEKHQEQGGWSLQDIRRKRKKQKWIFNLPLLSLNSFWSYITDSNFCRVEREGSRDRIIIAHTALWKMHKNVDLRSRNCVKFLSPNEHKSYIYWHQYLRIFMTCWVKRFPCF